MKFLVEIALTDAQMETLAERVAEKLGRAANDKPRTAREAAAEMNVSTKTVRRKVETGELPALPGSPLRISPQSIRRWITMNTQQANAR